MLLIKDRSSSPNILSWGSKSLESGRFWQYNFASLTAEASISTYWKERWNCKPMQNTCRKLDCKNKNPHRGGNRKLWWKMMHRTTHQNREMPYPQKSHTSCRFKTESSWGENIEFFSEKGMWERRTYRQEEAQKCFQSVLELWVWLLYDQALWLLMQKPNQNSPLTFQQILPFYEEVILVGMLQRRKHSKLNDQICMQSGASQTSYA